MPPPLCCIAFPLLFSGLDAKTRTGQQAARSPPTPTKTIDFPRSLPQAPGKVLRNPSDARDFGNSELRAQTQLSFCLAETLALRFSARTCMKGAALKASCKGLWGNSLPDRNETGQPQTIPTTSQPSISENPTCPIFEHQRLARNNKSMSDHRWACGACAQLDPSFFRGPGRPCPWPPVAPHSEHGTAAQQQSL